MSFRSFSASPRELDFQQLLQRHDEFPIQSMDGLESRVPETIWGSRRTVISAMLKSVRPHGTTADVLSPHPSDVQQGNSNSALFTIESPDSSSKDSWIRSPDKPSLEASIDIMNRQLIGAAGSCVMSSIPKPSSDVNAGRGRMAADPNAPRGKGLRIYEPSRLQGLSHNRSTREDIVMFFQQFPGGIVRRADFHKYYPKHDGLSSSKRMRKFEALWKSCTIWLPQYGAYILNPACLPGKGATLSSECTSTDDILRACSDEF